MKALVCCAAGALACTALCGRWVEARAPKPAWQGVGITAEGRQFWAFRTPQRPAVPTVQARGRIQSPIDGFVLAALEAKGLTLSPEADRLTLLRRAAAGGRSRSPPPRPAPPPRGEGGAPPRGPPPPGRARAPPLARRSRLRRFRGDPRRRLRAHRGVALPRLRRPRPQPGQTV